MSKETWCRHDRRWAIESVTFAGVAQCVLCDYEAVVKRMRAAEAERDERARMLDAALGALNLCREALDRRVNRPGMHYHSEAVALAAARDVLVRHLDPVEYHPAGT